MFIQKIRTKFTSLRARIEIFFCVEYVGISSPFERIKRKEQVPVEKPKLLII